LEPYRGRIGDNCTFKKDNFTAGVNIFRPAKMDCAAARTADYASRAGRRRPPPAPRCFPSLCPRAFGYTSAVHRRRPRTDMLKQPYLLFVGDARDKLAAKSAVGVWQWRPDLCVGQVRLEGCQAPLDLPVMSIEEGAAAGARTLIIGVANAGGTIPPNWLDTLSAALRSGLDLANGLHDRLADIPDLVALAAANGRHLHDVRHPARTFGVGTGEPRSGRRLLTVGTDCSVGKMYATLALERQMRGRGLACDFRATGQTGIFVAGAGVAVDAVVADFISGAVEWLAPAAAADHWDLIEGQGSLFHPSFAGVSLGLLHGAQAEALVMCHEPVRGHMRGLPNRPLPGVGECIEANLVAGRLTSPGVRCVGVAVNTSEMAAADAGAYLARLEAELGLPCVDPLKAGVGAIVDRLLG
jgi:uncharacterized NAD-dependent epimerase/dehydratase family protein